MHIFNFYDIWNMKLQNVVFLFIYFTFNISVAMHEYLLFILLLKHNCWYDYCNLDIKTNFAKNQ
jgi:hypothetical protein